MKHRMETAVTGDGVATGPIRRGATWGRWTAFLARRLPADASPTAAEVAALLRSFLECSNGDDLLLIACRQFGVRRTRVEAPLPRGSAFLVEHGLGPQSRLFSDLAKLANLHIVSGIATSGRRRFSRAHELAHLFLFTLLEHHRVCVSFKHAMRDSPAGERFCSELASRLLLPEGLSPSLGRPAPAVGEADADTAALTFHDLRRLAARHRISLQALAVALHRHPSLDELEAAVAVMGLSPNARTGRQLALRLWIAACPTWGHVIANRRVARQGFASAADAFDTLAANDTLVVREELWVRVRSVRPTGPRGGRWIPDTLATQCAYTAVDVRGAGRELIAIWDWPRPSDG